MEQQQTIQQMVATIKQQVQVNYHMQVVKNLLVLGIVIGIIAAVFSFIKYRKFRKI